MLISAFYFFIHFLHCLNFLKWWACVFIIWWGRKLFDLGEKTEQVGFTLYFEKSFSFVQNIMSVRKSFIFFLVYIYLSVVLFRDSILLSSQAQQSLDLIQSKIVKAAGDTTVIENSDVSPETVCIFFSSKSLRWLPCKLCEE